MTAVHPRVHVLLLNWNGWRDTLECLESVANLDYPNFQIVLCDNASTDGSRDRVREWAAGQLEAPPSASRLRHIVPRPVEKPISMVELDRATAERGGTPESRAAKIVWIDTGANLGFAGGNNVGLRYLFASGERGYVWLLNNDIVVARDSLSKMMRVALADATIGCAGATLYEYDRPDIVQSAGGGRVLPWQGMPRTTAAAGRPRAGVDAASDRLDFINGGCMLMNIDVAKRVGLIDERYFLYGEDVDYSLRVRRAGYGLAYVPDAEVWHKGGSSIGYGSARHDYYLVRNSLLLVHKFYPLLLPAAVGFTLYRCVLPKLARRQWERLEAVGRGYRDFARRVARPLPDGALAAQQTQPS